MRTNELQQIIAPQREDGILMASTDAGTGQLTMARAAQFFGAELVKPENPVGAALSQKAEKEPLTWYDLPLRSVFPSDATIRNELKYARDQYGTVYISGGSIRSLNDDGSYNPTIGSSVIFAQLPAGFRPGIYRRYPAIAEATGSIVPADVDIGESGYMQVHIPGSNAKYAIIALPTIMFPAGN